MFMASPNARRFQTVPQALKLGELRRRQRVEQRHRCRFRFAAGVEPVYIARKSASCPSDSERRKTSQRRFAEGALNLGVHRAPRRRGTSPGS